MQKKSLSLLFVIIVLLFNNACRNNASEETISENDNYWTTEKIEQFSKKYHVHDIGPEKFHFPRKTFLKYGYSPEGGYVKDFSVIYHENRWHVFHIDGRPGETCWMEGNEIAFGHASTSDFQHWIRHNMPLAIGDQDWEDSHVWAPFVYKSDSLFYMFYNVHGSLGNSNITLATSKDLEHWKKSGLRIEEAPGRDPFIIENNGETIFLFTYKNKIGACSSTDLKTWTRLNDVIEIPHGAPESCSVHKFKDKYLLWFNGWNIYQDSKMYAFYCISDSMRDFSGASIKQFEFVTDPNVAHINDSFIIEPHNICPISIEKIAGDENVFFVSYFRPQDDRYKLFFGEMDITKDPITIREINDKNDLEKLLKTLKVKTETTNI